MNKQKILLFCFISLLTACTITPKPITVNERYELAKKNLAELMIPTRNNSSQLTYYETLAHALKYNLDYRVKLVNDALQAGQLKLATYMMFPALNATGSAYTRSNDFSSFGVTSTGQPTDVLNSTPRTLRSARVGLTWNLLDFGISYIKAKQQSNRVLIAEEEARKQLQQLAQDVTVAYWNAYSAQITLQDTKQFQAELTAAKNRLAVAVRDKTVPKESLLNYEAALLEGNRRLFQLQYKYDKAMFDLKHLANLPLDHRYVLAEPPRTLRQVQHIYGLNFNKLDAITLVSRPELRGQNYQERIAQLGINQVIVQALPGVTLNYGWNYNSNKFLLNNTWMDRSVDAAWNLINLATLPDNISTAKKQAEYEHLKETAITMTVLTETRYAYAHYVSLSREYEVAHKQSVVADELYQLAKHRQTASIGSVQQVVLAKLNSITTKMDETVVMTDLATALGELFLSAGIDILPLDGIEMPFPVLVEKIRQNCIFQNSMDFKNYVDVTYDNLFNQPKRIKHA